MPEAVKDNDINGLYQKLNAIAQTGLTFSKDVFDTERYESLRHIATQLMASRFDIDPETLHHVTESGYATPKTDVRAFILRDGKLLMVREAEDGLWSLPGGWADVGDTPSTAVCREVAEETGLQVKATKLLGVWDRNLHGHPPLPWHVYKLIFLCEETGGSLAINHETTSLGFFDINELPPLSLTRIVAEELEVSMAIATSDRPTWFD
ncbi:ADP-ribose pyrophosphatase [Enterobacter sp. FS01]|jgi:ADP-ribose pyrophosphatase YjhB (NUDIX family)|uniref:NUDIX hydrolase n=1 Tax=Leclercia sp. TaxID=1898428 RepID=UPI000D11DCD4|nr:NUDIX hydrolase [Leclercia sp.]MCT9846096.1 NUDIX hydrolase [Leclercia adecarboxylata ATCC 23216 = NBRC 102595]PSS47524.1 ADP-ribose pyrophosphatase [Enterobacter sp. FS01]